jgi:hypothetical protein
MRRSLQKSPKNWSATIAETIGILVVAEMVAWVPGVFTAVGPIFSDPLALLALWVGDPST